MTAGIQPNISNERKFLLSFLSIYTNTSAHTLTSTQSPSKEVKDFCDSNEAVSAIKKDQKTAGRDFKGLISLQHTYYF